MKVTLEYITQNAEEFIGRMAGICYDANPSKESCIKRATKCASDGHLATLRFAHATFNIQGISRVCSHQFVRSKHLDFLQRSQRYCKELEAQFINPSLYQKYDLETEIAFEEAYLSCMETYEELLKRGVKKEDARFVLPEATHTEMNVVGNLQAWMDFIKLRDDKHAQWEIRQVARTINNLLHKECPNLFHWRPV